MRLTICLFFAILLSQASSVLAQTAVSRVLVGRKVATERIDDDAVIYDSTGRRMKLAEFAQLNRAEPGGHRLIPTYNEYGKPGFYFYRPATKEELETRRFMDRNPELSPKVGQPMQPFVMQGTDGKAYRLTDLAGKNVVLTFWVTLQSPGINGFQIERMTRQIKPYLEAGNLISLGVTSDMPDELATLSEVKTLPFVAVGDGRGFAVRYNVVMFPTAIVIDKTGTVVATLSGIELSNLGEVLQKLK